MKCKIISISRKPSDWEKQAIQFYSKQLPDHLKISHIDVKPSSSKSTTKKSVVKNEGEEILKYIDDDAYLILWDRKGKKITSFGFAELIREQTDYGKNRFWENRFRKNWVWKNEFRKTDIGGKSWP